MDEHENKKEDGKERRKIAERREGRRTGERNKQINERRAILGTGAQGNEKKGRIK